LPVADKRPLRIALTGSIAMGKSTVSQMIRDEGVPVFDADATVHELYTKGGRAVPMIAKHFPDAIVDDAVERTKLSALVLNDHDAIRLLENIVHPLVHDEQRRFLETAARTGAALVVFDIPLLYEGDRANEFDAVIVVSAPAAVQRERALARPGMTREKFEAILARQVPDQEKRRRADFVVSTGVSLEDTRVAVKKVISELRRRAEQQAGNS
jgi:dephospho-CoA kinase